jgi:hypothetical protein
MIYSWTNSTIFVLHLFFLVTAQLCTATPVNPDAMKGTMDQECVFRNNAKRLVELPRTESQKDMSRMVSHRGSEEMTKWLFWVPFHA